MEAIVDLLKKEFEQDFRFSDDEVIENLKICMEDLRRKKLDVPTAPENELPTKPFGLMNDHVILNDQRSPSADNEFANGKMSNTITQQSVAHNLPKSPSRRLSPVQSTYDNVEGSRSNRIHPTEQSPVRREVRLGEHRYVTRIQVQAESPSHRAHTPPKTPQIVTREYIVGLSPSYTCTNPSGQTFQRVVSPVPSTNGEPTVIMVE